MAKKPKIDKETYDRLCNLINADLNEKGHELLNPEPMVHNTGLNRPLTLAEQIKRIVRTNVAEQAFAQGHETFEEANDFDVDDGFETNTLESAYELVEEEYLPDPPLESFPEESARHADENAPGEGQKEPLEAPPEG